MSFQLQKISVFPETSLFSWVNPLHFISSLTAAALEAIGNISALFSEESTFSQGQEEEIRRVKAALQSSSAESELDKMTKKNTKLNEKIAVGFKNALRSSTVFGVKPRTVSFDPYDIQWVFRKENKLPTNPQAALREAQVPKPILKRTFSTPDVD
jgi:hypothetical protein